MKLFILMMTFALFFILSSLRAMASDLGPQPTNPGRYGEVVNCGSVRDGNGWGRCYIWNHLNERWEPHAVHCPTVGCDRKVPPANTDD